MKNKNRIAALISVLVALVAFCALLASCNGDGTGSETSGDTTTADQIEKNDGFAFVYEGVTIRPGADMSAICDKLSAYQINYTESPSCGYIGLDKVYTYMGFVINTYPEGDKDYVLKVSFTDDSVKTPEGIGVGSTVEEVKAAYGDATEVMGTLSYKNGCTLQILIKDGKVKNITYLSAD